MAETQQGISGTQARPLVPAGRVSLRDAYAGAVFDVAESCIRTGDSGPMYQDESTLIEEWILGDVEAHPFFARGEGAPGVGDPGDWHRALVNAAHNQLTDAERGVLAFGTYDDGDRSDDLAVVGAVLLCTAHLEGWRADVGRTGATVEQADRKVLGRAARRAFARDVCDAIRLLLGA